jgi:hypothetical protein
MITATRTQSVTSTRTATGVATVTRTATQTGAATATRTATRTAIVATATRTATPRVSGKKGAGGPGDVVDSMRTLGAKWGYSWGYEDWWNPVYEYVPMIWGAVYDAATVASVARNHPGSYWLIWNEPNLAGQADFAPQVGAQIYKALRATIKNADPSAKLIVGGVAYLNYYWLWDWWYAYQSLWGESPVVEGWAGHHYATRAYNSADWRSALLTFRDNLPPGGSEFWLTEWGSLESETVALQVMAEQTAWLEAQSWVSRYAWYAIVANGAGCEWCAGTLVNADGSLTELGTLYARLP